MARIRGRRDVIVAAAARAAAATAPAAATSITFTVIITGQCRAAGSQQRTKQDNGRFMTFFFFSYSLLYRYLIPS